MLGFEEDDQMNQFVISDSISYLAASDSPLSADIGMIKNQEQLWLYDVGNGERNCAGLTDDYFVVLSHFHADHTGNVGRIKTEAVYVSEETYKHVHTGTIVQRDLYVGNLHIFLLPSSHAKGCLGLEVDETWCFVGDALYSKVKDGCYVYNAQFLKEEIEVLKSLHSPYLLVSHYPGLIRGKDEVLEELKEIYGKREKHSAEIRIRIEAR